MPHDTDKKPNHLAPIKHRQKDLFIADLFDTDCVKDDVTSMEYPLFALKAGDNRVIRYEQNNFKVKISPEIELGRATIHDKDIWVYCISKIMHAMNEGREYDRTIYFTVYDYLKSTNRSTGGKDYAEAKRSLERLASTRLTTEIETEKIREAQGFGLIDSWRIEEEKDGRMIRVSVTLSNWLFRSIEAKKVLTISEDYFRLRKPLDRRIYELARKHCGNNKTWSFTLKVLLERTGSTTSLKEFRRAIKSLASSNQLPDYAVQFDIEKDTVIFTNRNYKPKSKIQIEQEQSKHEHNQKAKTKRLAKQSDQAIKALIKPKVCLVDKKGIKHYVNALRCLKLDPEYSYIFNKVGVITLEEIVKAIKANKLVIQESI